MKKILFLFLLVSTINISAQESVLLKLNYKKGDKYAVKTKQSIDSKAMGMNNTTSMTMEILEVKDGVITSETKIDKIAMDMMQAGMMMAYDTSADDEDVDEMGKMLKQQIDPMLKLVITSKISESGKVVSVEVEPSTIPNADQFKNQATISFPTKAVKVGDTWSEENVAQGMTINSTYTVKEILADKVILSATGKMTGAATGTVVGQLDIDKKTGITLSSNLETVMNTQGQEMKLNITTSMVKM